ncbi:MAG: phenylacetate--CoA ligase family protein [Acidobacteria bacterium]|nr:phenylacetate--CoA ligase family protein [Acidobacteriota bacterium]
MLTRLTEQFEKLALRTNPKYAIGLLGRVPPSVMLKLQQARFRRTLQLAAKTPFYREEFARRRIDPARVRHPRELGDFFTTGDDLRRCGPEAFLAGRADTAFETTGTTSSETKRVFFSNRELNEMGRASAIGLYHLGLRREDVVLSAFDVSFWVSPAVVRTAFQYLGCFHTEAGKIPPEEFYERARRYRPTVVFGEPSWIARFSEIAKKKGTWELKFLFAGGENLNEETRAAVERIWGAKYFVNYGQTESFGVIGVECAAQNGYHRNDLNFFFETPETDDDGFGELVYTTLTREVMPFIRYRSTDVTKLVETPCACGLFAARIARIKGRVDEMVVCGMGNISPWVFAETLRGVPGATDEWQVRVWHENKTDVVEWRIETDGSANGRTARFVEDFVRENLRARFPDFWKNLEMRLYELRIVPVAPGTLRTARKLKRIVALETPPESRKPVKKLSVVRS